MRGGWKRMGSCRPCWVFLIEEDCHEGKDCHKGTDILQDDGDITAMNVDFEKKHDNTKKSQLNSSKGKHQSKQRAKSKKSKGSSGSKVSVTTNGGLDSKPAPLKVDESKDAVDSGDVTNVLKRKDEKKITKKGKSKGTEDAGEVANVLSMGNDESNSTKKGKSMEIEDAGVVTNVLSKGKDENDSTKKGKSKQKLSQNDLSDNKQKCDIPNESQSNSFKGKGQNAEKSMSKTSKGRNAPKPAGKNIGDESDIHSTALKHDSPQKTEDAYDNDLTALKGDESRDNEDVMNVPKGDDESNSSKGAIRKGTF